MIVDSNEQAPTCASAREWASTHYDQEIIPLRYYSDQEVPRKDNPAYDPARDKIQIAHLRNCNKCSVWLGTVCDPEWIDRQRRLSRYCCPQLFGAVEEPERGQMRIELHYYSPRHYEGAHNWLLKPVGDMQRLGSLLINYCPFCGRSIRVPGEPGQ